MNKYIALSLLGAANAANSPLPASATFPKYPTTVTVASTDIETDNIKVTYQQNSGGTVNYGIYVAIRNDLAYGITQTLSALHATNLQAVEAAATVSTVKTRSFYQTSANAMGTNKGLATINTTAVTTIAQTGPFYAICAKADYADPIKCNGGAVGFKLDSTSKAQVGTNSANKIARRVMGGTANTTYLTHAWTWNNDILLASVMQVNWATAATAVEDGTQWCGAFKTTLVKAGTVASNSATNGLNGKSKCTFQFIVDDSGYGPTVTISKADYVTALVQWVEWLDPTALATDEVLPTTSATPYFIGDYATADGVFFNPLTAQESAETTWKAVTLAFAVTEKDPSISWAGSRGTAAYYSKKTGVFKETQISTIESGALIAAVNAKKDENSKYESVKSTYESDKTKYNDAVTKENDRLKDIFKAAFDPAVTIPTRPTSPSPPAAFQGPYLALDKIMSTSPTAWQTTATLQGDAAYLKFGTGTVATDYQAATKYATRLGYICMTSDSSKVADATTLASSGRVWGRLGQGTATVAANNAAPFYYGQTTTALRPGMMVSLLPNAITDGGLTASGKRITIDGKAVALDSTTYNAPGQPSKSSAPMDPPAGAKFLSVGLAATLVAASLY